MDVWDHGTGDTPKEKAKAYTTKHDTACYIPPQQGTQSNDNRVNNGQVPYQGECQDTYCIYNLI